jgi:pimeloyl-ACP methyl ester carboxylesterase
VTIKVYAEIFHQALTAIGVEQCLVFGHHTGASVAVQLEYDFPGFASKMALSGPTLLDQNLKDLLPKRSFAFPVKDDGSHLSLMWERVRGKDGDAELALSQRETLTGVELGDTYPDAYKAVIEQDYATQLQSVRCPTLVFAGTEDPLLGQLDNALALLPNGEKAIIEGARTYVCERNANEVSALLKNFFQ